MLNVNYFLFIIFPIIISWPDSYTAWQTGKPEIIKADALVKRYTNTSDTTYVINFWATWCDPCVKELPYFEKLNENCKNKKVKVILVSIDFLSDYDSRVIPFIKKKMIKSETVLLNESKPNEFIDKIHREWQGSIPATMILNNHHAFKEFFEKPLDYQFLESKIKMLGN